MAVSVEILKNPWGWQYYAHHNISYCKAHLTPLFLHPCRALLVISALHRMPNENHPTSQNSNYCFVEIPIIINQNQTFPPQMLRHLSHSCGVMGACMHLAGSSSRKIPLQQVTTTGTESHQRSSVISSECDLQIASYPGPPFNFARGGPGVRKYII